MVYAWHDPHQSFYAHCAHRSRKNSFVPRSGGMWWKQDTALCTPNANSRHQQFGRRGVQTTRKHRDNTETCQVFGKKAKMPNFPLPYFIASPSTDLIWQVPFHASQTHRPPRLMSNGPRWLLRDWIADALMELLKFLELLPRAGMGRQACPAFLDVDSLCQRLGSSGPMPYCDKAPKFRASICSRGSYLIPYLC